MSKGLKVLAWVVGVIVVLLVAATVAIKLYLTKERVLAWVVPPMEERLHRNVSIADVGAGLTGVHLDGLDVRAEGASQPLVAARRVQVDWNPWSLFGGTVEIVEVRLVEPRIHVIRLPDGSLNISDLTEGQEGTEEGAGEPEPAKEGEAAGGPPVDVVVRLFALEQGAVSFEDQSTAPARTYVLDGIDARVTQIALEGPIPYELSANLPFSAGGRFHSEGTMNLSTQSVDATLGIERLQLTAWNELLGDGPRFADGTLTAEATVRVVEASRITSDGTVTVAGVTLAAGESRGATEDVTLRWESQADLDAEQASVAPLEVSVAGQRLTASARAAEWSQRTQVQFEVASDELRLDPVLAILPTTEQQEGPEAAEPPAEEPGGPGDGQPAPSGIPLDARGDVRVGVLRHGEVEVENVDLHVELVDNQLRADPMTADLYEGRVNASANADLATAGPSFQAEVKADSVQAGPLLAAVSPRLEGALTGTTLLELSTQGEGGDLRALSSTAQLEVKDGKMVSHPLVQQFAQMFKVKEYETLNFYSLRADAGTSKGVATVNSLIFSGPRMQATGKGTVDLLSTTLDMHLAVALPREVAERIINSGKVLDALTDSEGWTRIPMRLTGQPSSPAYSVDSSAVEKIAKQLVGEKGKQLLEEGAMEKLPLEEDQRKLLERGLKSLMNGRE